MKKLIFNEILICSHKERRAKQAIFNPKRTLIYGKNDTGKSSLIKSIYITFGANPGKISQDWKDLNPVSLVKFSIDDTKYSILKDGKIFAIFDDSDKLIRTFSSVTTELGPFIANLLDFKLKLTDKQNKSMIPPPAFIFLPFYIDQDMSWSSTWNAFGPLQQFSNPKESVTLYHVGIRPNEYYEAQADLNAYELARVKLDEERKITSSLLKNLKEKLSAVDFNVDPEEFKEDIKELLVECESLKGKEELHKNKVVDLYNKKIVLETQINITEAALSEANKDYDYATSKLEHTVECPTCGAEYENSFAARFELAQDSDRCKELIHELSLDLQENQLNIDLENTRLTKAIAEVERIELLLQKKKGEIQLRDVIENAGRNEIKGIFDTRISELSSDIAENSRRQQELLEKLKTLEDKNRKNNILVTYRTMMASHLRELEVTKLSEKTYKNIQGKINDTGSSLPRALTAYYFSIFETIKQFSTSVYCPIVIDSPNQQAQDLSHIDQILKFIKDKQPMDTQLILGLEELYNMDFDCPIIELADRHHLLSTEDFQKVNGQVGVYLDQVSAARGRLF